MNIVEPSPDYIGVEAAANIVGCSTKTLRRAAHSGRLPCRYVMGRRGLQLVFRHPDLDHWLSAYPHRQRGRHKAARESQSAAQPPDTLVAMVESVSALQISLEASRVAITQLSSRLQQEDSVVARAQETIARLTAKLAELEREVRVEQTQQGAEALTELSATSVPSPGH